MGFLSQSFRAELPLLLPAYKRPIENGHRLSTLSLRPEDHEDWQSNPLPDRILRPLHQPTIRDLPCRLDTVSVSVLVLVLALSPRAINPRGVKNNERVLRIM